MTTQEAAAETAVAKAAEYLGGYGSRILDLDWRCAGVELGIIAAERHTLVAVEVRARPGARAGTPVGALGRARQKQPRRLAARLSEHGHRFDQIRIDVTGLRHDGGGGLTIEHVRGVA